MKARLTPVAAAVLAAFVLPAQAQDATTAQQPAPAAEPATQAADGATVLPAVVVHGDQTPTGYVARQTTTATKTDTPLRDVPQAVTVITRDLIRDQSMQNIGDAMRYVPGVGMAQGEGNRETPILRGNSSTSDFFVDGLRDDVQYYRDLYNTERLEVLKGPNAMIFGRGGVGGVINRVTRQADWTQVREVSLEGGTDDHKRVTVDVGEGFNDKIAARVTAMYEDSDSYRDHVTLERQGINPTLALRTGANTTVKLGYEYFLDERIADRGVPSDGAGRPFKTDESTFFGDPGRSPTDTEVNAVTALVEHAFGNGLNLRNSTRYGNYSKFYQNVFASGPVSAGMVPMQAYFAATDRRNLFNQTDLVFKLDTGSVHHTLLGGVELGRQVTDNLRLSGRFADGADADTDPDATFNAPASNPTIDEPLVAFVQGGAGDGNNESVTRIAAVYVQDQIEFLPQLQGIVGLRYDSFKVDFTNRRTGTAAADREIETGDDLLSPRLGLIYKPVEPVSVYASYTLSYLPRAGEQLSSLSPSNKAFDPEEYKNYEIGAKWDVTPDFAATLAVYQLDRSNVIIPPASGAGPSTLGDGSRTKGVELGVGGKITAAWSIAGGYAWQDGELKATTGGTAMNGATLAQLPKHTYSLWNRYDFTPMWGAGLGVYRRSDMFTTTSNTVTVEGYTRVDGAVFFTLNERLRAQLNVENLLDEEYYVNAHNDNNIQPGSPLAVRASITARF